MTHPTRIFLAGITIATALLGWGVATARDLFTSPYRPVDLPRSGAAFALGDVNGDQLPDIVSSRAYRLGSGQGTFGALTPFSTGGSDFVVTVVVSDIDVDGHGDMIQITSSGGPRLIQMRSGSPVGLGALRTVGSISDAPFFGFRVADMNSDSRPDLVVASSQDSLRVMFGDGLGNFPTSTTVLTGIDPRDIAIGDFDRDGNLDAAVVNYRYNQHGYVSVHLGLGGGVLGPRQDFAMSAVSFGTLITADLDNDGMLDLVASGGMNGVLLLGHGNGAFAPSVPMSGSELRVRAGDFDGDGLTDLAHVGGDQEVLIEWQQPSGSFSVQSIPATMPDGIGVADLDLDGIDDLVVAFETHVRVFTGNASRIFGTPGYLTNNGAQGSSTVGVGRLDDDEFPDHVGAGNGFFRVSRGLGDGSFSLLHTVPLGPGNVVVSSTLGDVNGDGNLDVVATESVNCGHPCRYDTDGVVHFTDATGRFTESRVLTRLRPSPSLGVADVNGDGYGDIITRIAGPVSGYPTISVILGSPTGPADADVQTEVPELTGNHFDHGDVNGDGRADFAGLGHVCLANANATFGAAIPYPAGYVGRPTIADLDGDGFRDLIVQLAGSPGGRLRIARGRGDGTFEPRAAFDLSNDGGAVESYHYSDIRVADFDGNGVADIMCEAQRGSTFLLGQGDLGFAVTPCLGAFGLPSDVDQDGRTDLVIAGSTYFNHVVAPVEVESESEPSKPGIFPRISLAGPNPVRDWLELRVVIPNRDARLELWDIAGRRVRSIALHATSAPQRARLPVADLAPGAYVVALRSKDHIATKRVSVVR